MKVLLILWAALLCVPLCAHAAQVDAEQYAASGAAQLPELLPQESRELLDGLDVTPQNAAAFAPGAWLAALGEDLRQRVLAPARALGLCLGVTVAVALARALAAQGTLQNISEEVGAAAAFLAVCAPMVAAMDAAAAAVRGAGAFLVEAVPVYAGILAAMGKSVGAGSSGALMMAAGNGVTYVAQVLILPLLYVLLAFAAVGAFCAPEFAKLSDSVYGGVKWALLFAVTAFTGLLSVQGALAGAADSAAGRAAKLVVKNAVPLVGGLLSDAAGAVQASVALLRSGVGAFALVGLLTVFAPLAAESAVWIGVLFLCATAAETFGLGRLSGLFSALKTVMQTLLACTASCAAVLLVCAGTLLAAGAAA